MITYAQARADVTSSPRPDLAGNHAADYGTEARATPSINFIPDSSGLRSRTTGGSGARSGYQGMSVTGAVGFADPTPDPPPRLSIPHFGDFQAV